MKLLYLIILILVKESHEQITDQKNVVVIMVDDLGFNDLSFRGSDEIPTPNIDALAYNGVLLNRFYTPPLCTPSRSSFMTGKYPFKIGMQHFVIASDEPWGLGLDQKVLPQFFKDVGYSTYLIGKWHLGFHQKQYTPTERGFDSFFGFLGPYIDYFDYTLKMFDHEYARGYDMRRNLTVARDNDPTYATDLFTNEAVKTISGHDKTKPMFMLLSHLAPHAGNSDFPVQAPQAEIEKFSHIASERRRTLAAMISILDRGVGAVVEALRSNELLDDTLIVFFSDNGGANNGFASTEASNYPLRGQKFSAWEGAIRVNALVYASFLENPGELRNQLMHVADLLPTLGRLAGVTFDPSLDLDGVDQWDVINYGSPQVRSEVIDFDEIYGFGSFIKYPFKLVEGSPNVGCLSSVYEGKKMDLDTYALSVINSITSKAIMSVDGTRSLSIQKIIELRTALTTTCSMEAEKKPCNPESSPCLFDIFTDPCEQNNLAETRAPLYHAMLSRYRKWKQQAVPTRQKYSDPACDPSNFNFTWHWWQNNTD